MRPGLLRVALVAASLAAPRAALASAPAVLNLQWSAPAACPRGDEVREMATALLGAPVTAHGAASTRVRARVRASAGAFVMTIETRSSSGTDRRRLRDARCAVLAEAAALIAVAAADPSLAPAGAGDVFRDTGEPGAARGDAGSDAAIVPPAPIGPERPGADDGVTLPPAPGLPPGPDDLAPGTGVDAPELAPGTGADAPVLSPGSGADAPVQAPEAGAGAPVLSPGTGTIGDRGLSPGTGVPGAARPRVGPRFAVRFGGLFDMGSVPGPTGGFALGGR